MNELRKNLGSAVKNISSELASQTNVLNQIAKARAENYEMGQGEILTRSENTGKFLPGVGLTRA